MAALPIAASEARALLAPLSEFSRVALAVSGMAAVLAASPALFDAVRIAGAAYLLWLGSGALLAAWRGGGEMRPAAPARAP